MTRGPTSRVTISSAEALAIRRLFFQPRYSTFSIMGSPVSRQMGFSPSRCTRAHALIVERHAIALKVCERINAMALQESQQPFRPVLQLELQLRFRDSKAKPKFVLLPKESEARVGNE